MSEQVILPRDVAEAVENLRSEGMTNWDIVNRAHGALSTFPDVTIRMWAFDDDGGGDPDLLMEALVDGYTIQQSLEQKMCEYYKGLLNKAEKLRERGRYEAARLHYAERKGVERTLSILDRRIDGINT